MVTPPVAAWLLAKNRRRRMAATLTVTATPVTTGEVGVAYAGFTVSASGGQSAPYKYGISYGSLPTGITINTWTGAVSGTPTEAGEFTAVIRVSDAAGNFRDTPSFKITVSE